MNIDRNFLRYAVTTLLKSTHVVKSAGDGKWIVNLSTPIPGFNQGEQFSSEEQISDRLISVLESRYEKDVLRGKSGMAG